MKLLWGQKRLACVVCVLSGMVADAHLMVFDCLPHGFWHDPELPESIEANQEANQAMAKFLGEHLK
jgi:hypothetical protein